MIQKNAVISECGQYRYALTRTWDNSVPPLHFVMLNPSTADADLDDPTIRRCIGFAKRDHGSYGGIVVVNLFAYRATKPTELRAPGRDISGPRNKDWLALMLHDAAQNGSHIIAAWGANAAVGDAGLRFCEQAKAAGVQLLCLGRPTKDGAPRHPLYVEGDAAFNIYSPG